MGRRGPKPEPGAVREQKEAVRRRRAARSQYLQPDAMPSAVVPPAWLKKEGLAIWNRLAPTLRALKLLSDADAPAFARYCRNYARWLEMQRRLDKHGEIYEIETASGRVRRADPAFLIGDRIERMLLAFEDRFGLNPAERQRIFVARAQTGVTGDLFGDQQRQKRDDDPAAPPTAPAEPSDGPLGFLN